MVSTLLYGAMVVVGVNGVRSDFFELSRSIKQGCPLSPSLFVLAKDSLHYLLRYDTLSPRMKGIHHPRDHEVSNIQFANDITILMKLEEGNMEMLMTKLDLFCQASSSKISIAKSIMLGWN